MGSRFGGGKLTSPWQDGLLIDGALAAALAAPVQEVVVVIGADAKVIAAVDALDDERLRIVRAVDYATGMSASLKAGIAALSPGTHGVFIFLGDMPNVPHALLEPLAEALAKGAPAAAPYLNGRRGHPVLLASPLFDMVMDLQGDNGAGGLLNALSGQVAAVMTKDQGILFDVDTR